MFPPPFGSDIGKLRAALFFGLFGFSLGKSIHSMHECSALTETGQKRKRGEGKRGKGKGKWGLVTTKLVTTKLITTKVAVR